MYLHNKIILISNISPRKGDNTSENFVLLKFYAIENNVMNNCVFGVDFGKRNKL